MEKRTLKAIPIEPPSEQILQAAKDLSRIPKEGYYILRARLYQDTMLLDAYSVDKLNEGQFHEYRIYHEHGHFDDYIVQSFKPNQSETWRVGTIQALGIYSSWRKNQSTYFADHESRATVREFLKAYASGYKDIPMSPELDMHIFKGLLEYQEEIAQGRIRRGNKKLTDIIDEEMSQVPEEPDNFKKWIEEEVLLRSRYIYYDYKKGAAKQKGRCTWCGAQVESESMRNNKIGICPECHSEITYKASARTGTIVDTDTVSLIQRCGDERFVLRKYVVNKRYDWGGRNPQLGIWEKNRTIYNHNPDIAPKLYYYGEFKKSGVIRWCDGDNTTGYSQALYPYNLQEVLKDTPYRYSAIDIFASKCKDQRFFVDRYLYRYLKSPEIEYLVKLGFYRLVADILERFWEADKLIKPGKTPQEVLEIPIQDIKRAARLDVNIERLRILQASNRHNMPVTDEELEIIATKYGYERNDVFGMAKYSTIHQFLKYMETQSNTISYYADYINMVKVLEWDLTDKFILFPRDLKEAHDNAVKLYKPKKDMLEDKAIKKAFRSLQERFGYQDEEYIIKAPQNFRELVTEGHKLHHCVGSYSKRIASGETVVMFIRAKKKPKDPYFTCEIDPDRLKIIQVHGKNNCNPPEELQKLIDTYKAEILNNKQQIAM